MFDKRAFRNSIRAEIRDLPADYLSASDAAIAEHLITLPEFINASRIFAYLSVGREVDTRRIMDTAQKMGKEIYLPVVLGNGIMEFARYDAAARMRDGALHIPEPDASAPRAVPYEQDLIIVPGLCFDADKFRMGQGGGYYDRYLAACSCISVGLARERLMPTAVPKERCDLPVDILVTECGVRR